MIYKEIKEKAMIDNVMNVAKEALTTKDYSGTWFCPVFRDNDNLYAVCFAYMDYENTGDYTLFGKIALQPRNSIMQCDYDMDWNCPKMNVLLIVILNGYWIHGIAIEKNI